MSAVGSKPAASEDREKWPGLLDLAARSVFELMMGSHLGGAPEQFGDGQINVTAVVGVAGKVCGLFSLRCTTDGAKLMASKMLGVEAKTTGREVWDAVGEVSNMIIGDFKHRIPGLGDGCMLSVPTVISGADYKLRALADSGNVEVRLLFEGLPLIVSLVVQS